MVRYSMIMPLREHMRLCIHKSVHHPRCGVERAAGLMLKQHMDSMGTRYPEGAEEDPE